MAGSKIFKTFKDATWEFFDSDAVTFAAAVALYAALSLAPLLIIFLSVTSYISPDARRALIHQMETLAGPNAGKALGLVLENINTMKVGASVSFVLGILAIVFAATGVFLQLQSGLNRIWGVQPKGVSVKDWLLKRLWSLLFIFGVEVVLLASVLATGAVRLITGAGAGWRVVEMFISFGVFVVLFALIYRYLPDAKITWKDVWVGAVITAILFTAGKFGMGIYFSYSGVGSAYGAAGSIVIMLLWVYYSGLIFFFGAELTQAFARNYGTRIVPQPYAEWTPQAKAEGKAKQPAGDNRQNA